MMAHWTKLVNCLKAECPNCSVLIPEGRHSCPRACFLFSPFLSIADEAQEAEAIQIPLQSWTFEKLHLTKPVVSLVLKILFMLYFLMMNSSKASSSRKVQVKFLGWIRLFCPAALAFVLRVSPCSKKFRHSWHFPLLSLTAQWNRLSSPSRGPP